MSRYEGAEQKAMGQAEISFKRRLGSGARGRKYLQGGRGPLNAPVTDIRVRATPITPSWLCECSTYNAPQRDHCTECQSDKPTDAT